MQRRRESRQQRSYAAAIVAALQFSHDAFHRAFVVRIEVDRSVHIPTETATHAQTDSAASDATAAKYERRPATPGRL